MITLAVQTAIGGPGTKAATRLSWGFNSLCIIGSYCYGANKDGIFLLNGPQNNSSSTSEAYAVFATTDASIKQPKHIRYLYLGGRFDGDFNIDVKVDDVAWQTVPVRVPKVGTQRVRVEVGTKLQGRYWTVKIRSSNKIRVDSIIALFLVRSCGIVGY